MDTSVRNSKISSAAYIAIMAAVTCVLGPLSIPIGPIPVSLTPFAIFLTVYILGCRNGTIAYCIYLLLGFVGLPVFSGFTGGAGKVLGPTGGYLISFILMAFIAGLVIEKSQKFPVQYIGCLAALVLAYAAGTLWLVWQAHMTIPAALTAAVLPFIPFDLIKIALALFVGKKIRDALVHAHLLPPRK